VAFVCVSALAGVSCGGSVDSTIKPLPPNTTHPAATTTILPPQVAVTFPRCGNPPRSLEYEIKNRGTTTAHVRIAITMESLTGDVVIGRQPIREDIPPGETSGDGIGFGMPAPGGIRIECVVEDIRAAT